MKKTISKIRVTIFITVFICAAGMIYMYCIRAEKSIKVKTKAEYLALVEKSYFANMPEWPPHPDRMVNKDDSTLRWFFEEWKYVSENLKRDKTSEYEKEIYKIFPLVYHPTDFKKYGMTGFSYLLKYKYAIVPSYINYGVVSDFNVGEKGQEYADKRLCDFYPKSQVKNLSYLYNIDPFKSVVNDFLDAKIWSPRGFYLSPYVLLSTYRIDKNLHWLKFDYVLFDSAIDKALVCINPWEDENGDEVYIYIYLSKAGKEWKINRIES